MKRTIQILALAVSVSSSAQDYVPMLSEEHTWKEQLEGLTMLYSKYWFDGDTTLDGHTYQKLYTVIENLSSNEYFYGLFREEPDSQRVYIWWNGDDNLLYDFSLETGDEVTIYPAGDPMTATVQSVDTETVGGESRKRINFELNGYTDSWVVGMGSVLGCVSPFVSFPDNVPRLNCFYIGNDLAWGNPLFEEECDPYLEEIPDAVDELQTDFFISPNPASTFLDCSFSAGSPIVEITITDAFGQILVQSKMNWATNFRLQLPMLADGIYLATARFANGQSFTGKVLIEN